MEMEDLEGSTEKHHIRWNAFESNICKTLGDLNGDKNFEDVTLVCDGQYLEANKVVSSVASSFFHRILKQNPHPHPLICLVGIKLSDLDALLDFAYFGEVSVATADLDTFLATAEKLEMKGLVPDKNHFEDIHQQPPVSLTQSTGKQSQSPSKSGQEPTVSEKTSVSENNNDDKGQLFQGDLPYITGPIEEVSLEPIKLEMDDLQAASDDQFEEVITVITISLISDRFRNFTMKICEEEKFGKNIGKIMCTICGKSFRDRNGASIHVEAHHFPGTYEYQCDQCDKVFESFQKWRDHRQYQHSEARNKKRNVK